MTVYLDHAATTPIREEAVEAWVFASRNVGNPSSVHSAGQTARRILEDAREQLAVAIDCDPIEVILTSGGTESTNLALQGLWSARRPGADAIVLPDGEHHATLDTVAWLHTHEGAAVRAVGLDSTGRIRLADLGAPLPGAALATALAANNEVGTLNDVPGLAAAAAAASVPLHVDAVGAFGHVPMSFRTLRGDADGGTGLVAMSLSAHKLGGPVGIGALVVARSARLHPLVHGGGQQRGLRSGTQDAAGAAAFAAAATCALAELDAERARLAALREQLVAGVLRSIPDTELLGDPVERLPGNAHVLFAGAIGETLLFLLDQADIAASTGSACQAGVAESSHVVQALGRTDAEARQVLRFTLGRTSTEADVDALLAALPDTVARARTAFRLR